MESKLMDQGPKDQNSETRDFSPANKGDDYDDVSLVDMELQPPIEDEIHSSAGLLEGVLNFSFASKAADPGTSRKPTGTAEFGTCPSVNTAAQDGSKQKEDSTRPNELRNPARN